MKIYSPMFWSLDQGIDYSAPIIHLADIVPRAGQTTFAYFDRSDTLHIGETLQLIWCPPVSDLNGWSEQPSEIAHSYLLQARVVRPVPSSASSMHLSMGKHRFELSVLSCENLLSALRALPEGSGAWDLQHNALAWQELTACGSAVVDGLTYLNASARHEAFMELILEVTEEQIVGFFCLHSDPGGMYQQIGRKRFTGEELRIVRHALDTAHVLHDTQDAYLATGD